MSIRNIVSFSNRTYTIKIKSRFIIRECRESPSKKFCFAFRSEGYQGEDLLSAKLSYRELVFLYGLNIANFAASKEFDEVIDRDLTILLSLTESISDQDDYM